MALVVTDSQNYTDIADAINQKLGTSNQYYPSEMADAILSISGGGGGDIDPYSTFVQMNPVASAFLADDSYENGQSGSVMESTYRPLVVRIAEDLEPGVTPYRTDEPISKAINLTDSGTLSLIDNLKYILTDSVQIGNYNINNITPDDLVYYINQYNNNIVQAGSLKGTGQIRMIHTVTTMGNGVSGNIRDIGGWTCDGGTIKYGKLFRGMRLNGSSFTISDTDRNMFRNLLGIRDEIDLRNTDQTYEQGITGSVFGSDVEWHQYSLTDYSNSLSATDPRDGEYLYKKIFTQIAYDVSHNNPIYLHCAAGCDRTGTTCCILEGILGVDTYNIDKDYELSSLTNFLINYGELPNWDSNTTYAKSVSNNRVRVNYSDRIWESLVNNNLNNVPTNSPSAWKDVTVTDEFNRYRTDSRWTNFLNSLNSRLLNATFRDNVVDYLLSIGVPIEDINTIRNNMIDGNPQQLVAPTCNITYDLDSNTATSTNTDTTINKYKSYRTTINPIQGYGISSITVTMGGVNITSLVVSGYNINIEKVTGSIAIAVTTAISQFTITRNLIHASIESQSTSSNIINYGSSYTATIAPESGYMILNEDITVTVDGSSSGVIIENGTGVDEGKKLITINSVTGNLVIDCEARSSQTTYTVTYNLTKIDGSTSVTEVVENAPYVLKLTPQTGCNFVTPIPTCTMGGNPITIEDGTESDVGKKIINIQAVTGNIIITAVADNVDIVSTAFFANGTYYSALGFTRDYRLASKGQFVAYSGRMVLGNGSGNSGGYIPIENSTIITVSDAALVSGSTSIAFYTSDINSNPTSAVPNTNTIDCVYKTTTPYPTLVKGQSANLYAPHSAAASGFYDSSLGGSTYTITIVLGTYETTAYYYDTAGGTWINPDYNPSDPDSPESFVLDAARFARMSLVEIDANTAPVVHLYAPQS